VNFSERGRKRDKKKFIFFEGRETVNSLRNGIPKEKEVDKTRDVCEWEG
jgi:hypothetical protein